MTKESRPIAAATFDPYYKWLGISAKDQPPNHYRLLGIEMFETDADVIANAADQRMAHLRSFQVGKYAAESQRLLNEVAAAKVCLLNKVKKTAYDVNLRALIPAVTPPPIMAQPVPLSNVSVRHALPGQRAVRLPIIPIAVAVAAVLLLAGFLTAKLVSRGSSARGTVAVAPAPAKESQPAARAEQPSKAIKPSQPATPIAVIAPPAENRTAQLQSVVDVPIINEVAQIANAEEESLSPEPQVTPETKLAIEPAATREVESSQPPDTRPKVEETTSEPSPPLVVTEPVPQVTGAVPVAPVDKFGEWDDGLKQVNTAKHTIAGNWKRRGSAVGIINSAPASRIVVPIRLNGPYDIEFTYTINKGTFAGAIIPVFGKLALLSLDGDSSTPAMGSSAKQFVPELKVKHTVLIKARNLSNQTNAQVTVLLDDKPYATWEGNTNDLLINELWAIPESAGAALVADDGSDVSFFSLKFRQPQSKTDELTLATDLHTGRAGRGEERNVYELPVKKPMLLYQTDIRFRAASEPIHSHGDVFVSGDGLSWVTAGHWTDDTCGNSAKTGGWQTLSLVSMPRSAKTKQLFVKFKWTAGRDLLEIYEVAWVRRK